ncbi:MAG: DNA polymerase III subunit gamma/tau [Clostridiales bacterium]|nr:DNA polymerase III subunit gamma/tau [Clostridiales bacterium]
MYQALYRARRPEVFSEVLGQEHIIKILKHQIRTGRVSHAYLFAGTRGTGKTTMARLLAKALNCTGEGERPCGTCPNCRAIAKGSFMDVIEIDAASNNGVDNIRELRESVKYPPQVGSKKIYIIDEVHMLSSGAFNALLKTLEEPPENVIFVLCTTEPQKLPQTILSRCMRLDFKRVPQVILAQNMREICEERGVEISDGALKLLASNADGSVRDGLSILDQVLASGDPKIDREDVLEYLGTVGSEFFIELTELVALHKTGEALVLLDKALSEGKDAKQLMKDWNAHYRNLLITKFMKDPEDLLNMSEENIERVKEQSSHISFEEIDRAILRISKTINEARWSTQPRILMELDIVALSGARGSYMREAVPRVETQPERLAVMPRAEAKAEPKVEVRPEIQREPEPQAAAQEELRSREIPVIRADDYVPSDESVLRREPEQAEMPQPEPQPKGFTEENIDLENLWRDVMEEGEVTSGSFNLIRSWTRLKELRQNTYTVAVSTDFARKHVQEKMDTMDKIMTIILKRPLKGSVIVEKNTENTVKRSEPDYAREVKDALGLDIIVED